MASSHLPFLLPMAAVSVTPGLSLSASTPNVTWSSPNFTYSVGFLPSDPPTSPPSFIVAVSYSDNVPIWSTSAAVDSGGSLTIESSGNLVLLNGTGATVWESRTSGRGVSSLVIDDTSNLALRNGSSTVWSSFDEPTDSLVPSQKFTIEAMGTRVQNSRNSNAPTDADEKLARQKEIDDWLPITSSRNAKWWYSAFHNVTAVVGAGVLSLPYAMSELGWGPGVVVLVLSWIITWYTLWQMVEMHEMVPGKRFDRYHELGQHAFGEKLGLYIVVPQQLVVEVGTDIVYMVTGGKSLKKFHDTVCPNCKDIKLTYFIMIFASAQFLLSHLPNFNSISVVSLIAAVMSLCYSTISWGASVHKGVQSDVDYGHKAQTTAGNIFNFFSALGDVAFAYAGHNVVLEIQATIPSTPEKPSKGPMWRGVIVAYIVVALCYFPVALIGYRIFGNKVEDNILITLEKPAWLIAMANMFVVVHVIGGYQIFAMPVFDMIETVLVKKLNFRPSFMLRFVTRNLYVAFTMFVGVSFPFFGGLLGFFGGFALAPTTYFLPCIMWLVIYKPRKFSLSWWTNWICIILGVLLIILAPIGALRQIILQAKDYKFYS